MLSFLPLPTHLSSGRLVPSQAYRGICGCSICLSPADQWVPGRSSLSPAAVCTPRHPRERATTFFWTFLAVFVGKEQKSLEPGR